MFLATGNKKIWQSFKNDRGKQTMGKRWSISRDFYSRPLHRVHEDTLSNPIPFPAYHLSPGKKMSPDDHGHRTWKMERRRQHPTGIPFYHRVKVSSLGQGLPRGVVGHNWSRSVSINQNHRRRGKKRWTVTVSRNSEFEAVMKYWPKLMLRVWSIINARFREGWIFTFQNFMLLNSKKDDEHLQSKIGIFLNYLENKIFINISLKSIFSLIFVKFFVNTRTANFTNNCFESSMLKFE